LCLEQLVIKRLQALEKKLPGRFHSLMVSFLHSADWQIGKPYARILDPDKRARLRQVRLDAIGRIGSHIDATTAFLLVAGDLFDSPTPSSPAM
jgi:DNA repair exonuclease SbcCD nuclease subunit